MRIPGGDLAPARRRRYGGSYGRRRRRRNLRLAAGLVLVLAGAGAAYVLRQDDTAVPDRLATRACPTSTPTPAPTAAAPRSPVRPVVLPAPAQVRLTVLNGTNRDMLAKHVGDQLAALGFVVTGQANAPAALAGPSRITFGPGAGPAATLVSHWVPGSTTLGSARAKPGSVVLVLGSSFVRLATPGEAAAAGRPAAAPAQTSAAAVPEASSSPTCSP